MNKVEVELKLKLKFIKRMPWTLSYCHCFIVFVCTGESEPNTLSVDAYFFENEEKIYVFKNIRTLVHEA